MTISTLDQLVAAFNSAQTFTINKASVSTQGAAGYSSLWRATGTPGQGAIPAAAAQCDDTLLGAILSPMVNAGASAALYLANLALSCANGSSVIEIHDRICHMGGLSGTTATVQNVNLDASGAAAGRIPNLYADLMWWLEIYTDIGTGAQTATIEYDSPNSGSPTLTTTVAIGGASPLNQDSRIFPVYGNPLYDSGQIKKIRRVTHATTGTAGSYGFTCTRRLASIPLLAAAFQRDMDWSALGLPVVPNDACLTMIELCGTTSTGIVLGNGKIITG